MCCRTTTSSPATALALAPMATPPLATAAWASSFSLPGRAIASAPTPTESPTLPKRNLISGNPEAGIHIDSNANVVAGNYIGTNADGNAPFGNGVGVRIGDAGNNTVGGTPPGARNVIAFNTAGGVLISSTGTGNAILGNSIFGNTHLGIDLSLVSNTANGVTPNDPGDADSGPNALQNFPQITNALSTSTKTVVSGTLHSTPGTASESNSSPAPWQIRPDMARGRRIWASSRAGANDFGTANFVASFSTVVPAGQFITATATDPSGNTSEFSASIPVVAVPANVVYLPHPTAGGLFIVSSPLGTTLTASITKNPGVAPPSGIEFPFGFIDFTVTGVTPGSAANITIAGLDTSEITTYVKHGSTPANPSDHWYSFQFGQPTDSDTAVGTGMEIVGGNIVLHMIDGGRGDDNLAANGVITDIGGPVSNKLPVANDLSATVTEDGNVAFALSATDVETPVGALLFTVTSLPSQGQLSTANGVSVLVGDRFTGPPTLMYEPGAAREGNGSDSFNYTVTDAVAWPARLTDAATVTVTTKKAVDDGKVTVDANGIVRIGGTSGNDDILATRSGNKLQVKINGKSASSNISLSSVREIRAWGRSGNDKITVALVDVPTLLHGGTGNDQIVGGLGSNLIFGGTGDDKLLGGVRNDLLVGGTAADTIVDALGDDIHVGGHVANQLTDDFFRQVLAQWTTAKRRTAALNRGSWMMTRSIRYLTASVTTGSSSATATLKSISIRSTTICNSRVARCRPISPSPHARAGQKQLLNSVGQSANFEHAIVRLLVDNPNRSVGRFSPDACNTHQNSRQFARTESRHTRSFTAPTKNIGVQYSGVLHVRSGALFPVQNHKRCSPSTYKHIAQTR